MQAHACDERYLALLATSDVRPHELAGTRARAGDAATLIATGKLFRHGVDSEAWQRKAVGGCVLGDRRNDTRSKLDRRPRVAPPVAAHLRLSKSGAVAVGAFLLLCIAVWMSGTVACVANAQPVLTYPICFVDVAHDRYNASVMRTTSGGACMDALALVLPEAEERLQVPCAPCAPSAFLVEWAVASARSVVPTWPLTSAWPASASCWACASSALLATLILLLLASRAAAASVHATLGLRCMCAWRRVGWQPLTLRRPTWQVTAANVLAPDLPSCRVGSTRQASSRIALSLWASHLLLAVTMPLAGATVISDSLPPVGYSLQHVPNYRRALQTTVVSDVAGLTSALDDATVGHIVIAAGHYLLSAELSVTRSVTIEAAVVGSVVLDAGETRSLSYEDRSDSRRVLHINPPSPSDVIEVIGVNVTGGSVAGRGDTGFGGGVLISNGQVTMKKVAIYGNFAIVRCFLSVARTFLESLC